MSWAVELVNDVSSGVPPVRDITLFMSLGIEQAKKWKTKDDPQPYLDGLFRMSTFRNRHPEAYQTACDFHGKEVVDDFASRVRRYNLVHLAGKYRRSDAALGAATDLSYLTESEISDEDRPFTLEDEDANTDYVRFTDALALDVAHTLGRATQRDVVRNHLHCVMFGSDFMQRFIYSGYSRQLKGIGHVRFISGLDKVGAPVWELKNEIMEILISKPVTISYADDIVNAVRDGVPLEYALDVL